MDTLRDRPGRILVAALLIGVGFGLPTISIIDAAWSACIDVEPAYRAALLFLYGPIAAALAITAWAVGFRLTRGAPFVVRVGLSIVLSLFVCYAVVINLVPADIDGPEPGFGDTCGPDGMPRWWPM